MRLTTPLDLPAPGRHQALYVILRFQQSPKFLLNSHEAQFTATLSHCIATALPGHSFFRSYGASLPSSLTMVISRALGFSPHPPVSDYGTVIVRTPYEVFLGSVIRPLRIHRCTLVSVFDLACKRICLSADVYNLSPGQPFPGWLTLLRPSLGNDALTIVQEY